MIIFEDGDGGEPNLTKRAVNGVRSRPHRGDAVSCQRDGHERLRLLLFLLGLLLHGEILQREESGSWTDRRLADSYLCFLQVSGKLNVNIDLGL